MTKPYSGSYNEPRPFPQARKSTASEAEDAFMQEYGGIGPRLLLRSIDFISACLGAPVRLLSWAVTRGEAL